MFSGIVTHSGTIESAEMRGDLRVIIACDFAPDLQLGESVACNGACLTVVNSSPRRGEAGRGALSEDISQKSPHPNPPPAGEGTFTVDLSAETVSRTAPGQWQKGRKVNLERSLKLGDRLDGHLVSGHVDGLATIKNITISGDSHSLEIESPQALARFMAEKGSVTLDGVSLTVNKVENSRFWVNIIPHTWQNTTLGERKAGDALNLEIDMLARYVARLLEERSDD